MVEHLVANEKVASPNLVFRSTWHPNGRLSTRRVASNQRTGSSWPCCTSSSRQPYRVVLDGPLRGEVIPRLMAVVAQRQSVRLWSVIRGFDTPRSPLRTMQSRKAYQVVLALEMLALVPGWQRARSTRPSERGWRRLTASSKPNLIPWRFTWVKNRPLEGVSRALSLKRDRFPHVSVAG